MTRTKRLTFFTAGYNQVAIVFPYVVTSPAYFSGAMQLGGELSTTSINEKTNEEFTLKQALSTASFWVVGISSAVYGLIASGIALFNESILAERGFDASTYHRSLVIVALTALVGNFLGGWLSSKWKMTQLLAFALILLAGSLVALPHVSTQTHVAIYAVVMGLAGGFVIVIFFSFWSSMFGRTHLGKIQGVAQSLTVIASAVGPLILAECLSRTGSYASIFNVLTVVVLILAVMAWFVRVPQRPLLRR